MPQRESLNEFRGFAGQIQTKKIILYQWLMRGGGRGTGIQHSPLRLGEGEELGSTFSGFA